MTRLLCRVIFYSSFSLLLTEQGWGACRLNPGTELEHIDLAICNTNILNAHAGQASAGREKEAFFGTTIDGYLGAYLGPRFSLHAKGYLKEIRSFDQADGQWDAGDSRIAEQVFLQIGHPLMDNFNAAAGRLPTPFGLNHEFLRHQLPTRALTFWDRTVRGLRLGWKIRNDLRVEIGGAWAERRDIAKDEAEALTLRITQHFDLLGGAKLIGSYQNHAKREFGKVGIAAIVFQGDDSTSLEWVRIADRLSDQSHKQIFRFVHEDKNPATTSWSFGFEDIRRDSYRIYSKIYWRALEQVDLGTGIQYQQDRSIDRQDKWWLLLTADYSFDFHSTGTGSLP